MNHSVVLMWGLPGSGKTHFVRETYLKNSGRSIYTSMNPGGHTAVVALDYKVRATNGKIDLIPVEDTIYGMKLTPERRLREFESSLNSVEKLFISDKVNTLVVDTPCCSYDYFKTLVNKLSLILAHTDLLEVEAFRENREVCKINDYGRRNVDSQFSIDNMPLDFPDASSLIDIISSEIGNRNIKVMINEHTVFKKDSWKGAMQKYLRGAGEEYDNNSILKSTSYSLGGTLYGIGGESMHQIEAEPMGEFTELDNLLIELCPELPFIFYKQIKDTLVEVVEQDDSDYYSKCSSAHYEIDLKKLYDFLIMRDIKLNYTDDDTDGRAEYDWEILERLHH